MGSFRYSEDVNHRTTSSPFKEHGFLRWLREEYGAESVVGLGIGDDAAWSPTPKGKGALWAMDTVVAGVHVASGEGLAARMGRKAVLVNLSDIAAMGGIPDGALLSIALPETMTQEDAEDCARAAVGVCREYGVQLLGGDTVSTRGPMVVTIAINGHSDVDPVTRAGALRGDKILVTGALGGSLHDGRHGDFKPRLKEAARLMELARPSAMTDISDGLARDLSNILIASCVGAVLNESAIPIHPSACALSQETEKRAVWHALNDGEDFELLLTVGDSDLSRLKNEWNLKTPLTVIGTIEGDGLFLDDGESRAPLPAGGFDHGVR